MKNTLLALIVALVTSLFAVIPQSVYADSIWTEQVSEESGLRYVTYTVRRGDKLEHIARNHSSSSYKISVANIIELNLILIKNPNRILVGQKLRLPVYYAKEAQAVVPATVQAAVEAAVAPKNTALAEAKREQILIAMTALGAIGILLVVILFMFFKNNLKQSTEDTKAEVFLTTKDEIQDLLKKCTGRDVAAILESELVEVPRNPGSTVMNKKKLVNLKDLIHNNPELYDMPLELWSAHLAVKMNRVAPASAESA